MTRQYREYVEEHYAKYPGFQNPLATPRPDRPKHGDGWGRWMYNQTNLTLELHGEKYGYEIDLERCNSAAEALDWIFQIAGKTWATPEVLGTLVQAVDDLLNPQAHLCSFGRNRTMDVRKHLASAA